MVVPWRATRYEKTPEGNLIVYIFGEVKNDYANKIYRNTDLSHIVLKTSSYACQ